MFESEIPLKTYQTLGASTVIVSWPDVYTAITTGVVDGLTGTVLDNFEFKHFEQAKFWTNISENFQLHLPYMSKDVFESLTEEQQAAVAQAMSDMGPVIHADMVAADQVARLKARTEMGVALIDPPMGPWIDKVAPAHSEFEKNGLVEEGLIGRILAIE